MGKALQTPALGILVRPSVHNFWQKIVSSASHDHVILQKIFLTCSCEQPLFMRGYGRVRSEGHRRRQKKMRRFRVSRQPRHYLRKRWLDLEADRASIFYEQQTAENLGCSFRRSCTQDNAVEWYCIVLKSKVRATRL